MKPDRTTWIFSAVLFLLAAAFTVFIGFTVARMSAAGYSRADGEDTADRTKAETREEPKDSDERIFFVFGK